MNKMITSANWFKMLKFIQCLLNNVIFAIIDKILNKIDFDFFFLQVVDLNKFFTENFFVVVISTIDRIVETQQIRIEITNAIIFVQMNVKHHYDRKHQSLFMKKNEYALIRLHHKYQISVNDIFDKKYKQQYVDFFEILKKIDKLTYRLDLSIYWRIYFVFSVAQLKFVSSKSDFYQRSRFNHFDSIFVEDNIQRVKSYKIDFLINKRATTRRELKYLIRWKEYESKYDEWRNISKFNDVMNLIKNYEQVLIETIFLFDRLELFFTSSQSVSVFSFIRRLKLFFTLSQSVFVSSFIRRLKLFFTSSQFVFVFSFIRCLKLSFTSQKFVFVVVSITTLILSNQRFVVVISFRKILLNRFNQFTSLVNSSTSISISNALIRQFDKLKKKWR